MCRVFYGKLYGYAAISMALGLCDKLYVIFEEQLWSTISTSNINDMVETSSSNGAVCSHDDNDDDFSSFDTFMSHLIG